MLLSSFVLALNFFFLLFLSLSGSEVLRVLESIQETPEVRPYKYTYQLVRGHLQGNKWCHANQPVGIIYMLIWGNKQKWSWNQWVFIMLVKIIKYLKLYLFKLARKITSLSWMWPFHTYDGHMCISRSECVLAGCWVCIQLVLGVCWLSVHSVRVCAGWVLVCAPLFWVCAEWALR